MRFPLILSALLAFSGCGPLITTSNIIQADAVLEEASILGAERFAPYWYHSAEIYLAKARELDGHSEYQFATEYAGLALVRARKALKKTKKSLGKRAPSAAQSTGEYTW